MADTPTRDWLELLLDAASATPYPPTPSLAEAVLGRIDARPASPAHGHRRRLSLAMAAIGVGLLALAAATVVSRDVRDAVAGFLGLAVEGERIELLPTPGPGVTPTPFPTPQNIESFATPIALGDVEGRLGFVAVLPGGRGVPEASYIAEFAGGRSLILDYETFDLWESREAFFEKFVFSKGVSGPPRELTINGRPAYWISGAAHIVRFIGPDGRDVVGSQRTVLGNTLVWRGATLNYRLEVDSMSLEEALAIAESLP